MNMALLLRDVFNTEDVKATKRVAIFVRRSKDETETESMEYQELMCRRKAEQDGDLVVEVVYETVSAYDTTIDKRPGLQRLFVLAENGLIDKVICWQRSRLVRDVMDSWLVRELLVGKYGCEIAFSDPSEPPYTPENFDSSSVDSLIDIIRSWSNQIEVEQLRRRIKEHMRQRAQDGRYVGGRYTGYRWNEITSRLEPVPEELEAVRLMFDWYLNTSMSTAEIAKELNKRGYRTKYGNKFRGGSVCKIMRSKIYCGYYRWGFTTSRRRSRPVQADGYEKKVDWVDPIVSLEDWERVQRKMNDRGHGTRGKKRDFSLNSKSNFKLSGKISCWCGRPMGVRNGTRKYKRKDGTTAQTTYMRYVCTNREQSHPFATKVNSKMVDQIVAEAVTNYVKRLDADDILRDAQEQIDNYLSVREDEIHGYKHRYEQLERECSNLMRHIANTERSDFRRRYEAEIQQREAEMAEIRTKVWELEQKLRHAALTEKVVVEHLEFLQSFQGSGKEPSSEALQTLIDHVVDSVCYCGDYLLLRTRLRFPIDVDGTIEFTEAKDELVVDIT
jgi:site-specific DNA recombinase